jgi:pimeloyl-ACP methyl ester carboxylesterase/DNA-binding CsgD family transcriptional regulator
LVISKQSFAEFMATEWPEVQLPASEVKMLQQLIVGQTPREAATADGVGYETKRTYLKSICRKLNLSGQTALVSAVLGRLLIVINASEVAADSSRSASATRTFKSKFLPDNARVLQMVDEQGRTHRILDVGALSGQPVLVVLSTIAPYFGDHVATAISRRNLRLLIPLRHGVLDPDTKALAPAEFHAHAIAGLALTKALIAGPDAPVVGLSSGGNYAVRFACEHPELVSELVLASMTFQPPRDGTLFGRFLTDFTRLVSQNATLVGLFVDHLLKLHQNPIRFRRMNDKIFPPDGPDGRAMQVELAQTGALEAYMHYYQNSPVFLKADAHASFYASKAELSSLNCPVHLLHGTANTRDEIQTIRDLVTTLPMAKLTERAGAGQILRGDDLDAVWDILTVGHAQ